MTQACCSAGLQCPPHVNTKIVHAFFSKASHRVAGGCNIAGGDRARSASFQPWTFTRTSQTLMPLDHSSKPTMDLPQEIIDEILGYLPSNDRRPLKNCSLVSKSWLRSSQRYLFAHVALDGVNYRSWLSKILPTNTGLLRNVRSLTYFLRRNGDYDLPSHILAPREYLPSFSKLQALTLFNVDIKSAVIDNLEIFSAFQQTLVSLRLIQVSVTWSAFVGFIGCFPHLRTLGIHCTSFRVDDWPIPRISHVLRGRLVVESSRRVMGVFFDRFPKLRQEYEELMIVGAYEDCLAAAVETSLRFLRIGLLKCKSPTYQVVNHSNDLLNIVRQRDPHQTSRVLHNYANWRSLHWTCEESRLSSRPSLP